MERNVRVMRITGRTPFPEEKGTKTRREGRKVCERGCN